MIILWKDLLFFFLNLNFEGRYCTKPFLVIFTSQFFREIVSKFILGKSDHLNTSPLPKKNSQEGEKKLSYIEYIPQDQDLCKHLTYFLGSINLLVAKCTSCKMFPSDITVKLKNISHMKPQNFLLSRYYKIYNTALPQHPLDRSDLIVVFDQ